MATYDLGKVVGEAGEKGDDGSTVWNTSTAPTYANSKYTFTISNLSGKTGLQIAVNDIIFYSTYYYIVSAVGSTTVDCNTRVNIKGSDASVTIVDNLNSTSSTSALSAKQGKVLNDNKIETSAIVTSFGSTPSDSKVASEKLVKNSLDGKQATLVSGSNIKTINNNSLLGSGNIDIQGSSVDIVTSWETTPSDSKVASEKLVKDSLDSKLDDNLSSSSKVVDYVAGDYVLIADYSDGFKIKRTLNLLTPFIIDTTAHSNIGSSANANQSVINGLIDGALGDRISKSSTTGLVKNDGSIDTTAYSTFSGSYSDLTNKPSIPSASSDLSDGSSLLKKSSTTGLIKNDGTIDTTVYSTFDGDYDSLSNKPTIPSKISDLQNDSDFIETSSTAGLIKNDGTIDTSAYITNSALGNYVQKSNTTGLIKNDGTIDTTSYSTFSGDYDDLSDKPTIPSKISDLTNDSDFIETSSTTGLVKNDGTIDTNTYLTSSALTNYVQKSSTTGLLKNDGTIDTTQYLSSLPSHNHDVSQIIDPNGHMFIGSSEDASQGTINTLIDEGFSDVFGILSHKISTSSTVGLIKNDGSVDTNTYLTSSAISGMLTTSDVANDLTTTTSGKVLDARQGKVLADLIGDAITYINGTGS